MSEWQDIATAPRDKPVLLGWPAIGKDHGKVSIGIFGGQAWPSHYGRRAAHWQPLPAPPEEAATPDTDWLAERMDRR